MIRVLITGSGGMLGRDLCEELNAEYELFGLDLSDFPDSLIKKDHFIRADITANTPVVKKIKGIDPQVIIHTAAYTDVDGCELNPDKAHKVNVEGTKTVALAALETKAVLFYISTDFVFDGKKKEAYTEEDAASPLSVYGKSKLEGEDIVRQALEKFLIIRTSWLFGRGGKNFAGTIMRKAAKEKLLKVVNDQIGSPTYTKDLSAAIKALLSKVIDNGQGNLFGIYHISNSGICSWYEFAEEIIKIAQIETELVPISTAQLRRPARRPAMSVMSHGHYEEMTGAKMRHWREALRDYIRAS